MIVAVALVVTPLASSVGSGCLICGPLPARELRGASAEG